MPIQGRKSHLIEVNEADVRDTASSQGSAGMAANTTASDNGDKGGAKGVEARRGQEDTVSGELFQDEVLVVVAATRTLGELRVSLILGIFGEYRVGAAVFSELLELGQYIAFKDSHYVRSL